MITAFIDGENIKAVFAQQILDQVKRLGDSYLPPKVYISNGNLNTEWLSATSLGYVPEIVVRKQGGKGKSMVDAKMFSDIYRELYRGECDIEWFVICTDDADFHYAVQSIKSQGKKVCVMSTRGVLGVMGDCNIRLELLFEKEDIVEKEITIENETSKIESQVLEEDNKKEVKRRVSKKKKKSKKKWVPWTCSGCGTQNAKELWNVTRL